MPLIIEDGTIVEDANSFATVAECRAFVADRGLTLPTEDAEVEVLLVKANDYLNSLEERFNGYRYDEDQEMTFPRDDISLHGKDISNTIPKIVKRAQCQLAVDAQTAALLAAGTGKEVIEKKVGPLSTKFAPNGATAPQYRPTAALAILEPLFKPHGGINLTNLK
tara:strand:+ start:594 stop:1088 length:495 start_codon:yes stop_codon:yes gene_type:complete